MVVDHDGVIIASSAPNLRLRTIAPLSPDRRAALIKSRQFGDATLADAGIRLGSSGSAVDAEGRRFILVEKPLPLLGWRHLHLEPLKPVLDEVNDRVRLASLIFALGLAALLGAIGWGSTRRRRVEGARVALEAEVSRRTSELTHAYERLRLEGEEREKADGRYRAAREELAQANRLGSIGTITTSVAHEINQPVAAIRTAAENGVKLLARGQTEIASANLTLIVSLTERIGAITGELLSYARRRRREPDTVALDEVVDGAVMLIGHSFARSGASLKVVRAAALPEVRVSRIGLEQVLVNLLQNALDAVVGLPDPRVLLEVEVDEGSIRFLVHDNGPGLPPHLGDSVFQPFVTGKPNGTGLGLGISREIVADHGGSLVADVSPLGGALFHVALPRRLEASR
jgi:two-component system C4-dicarboxylate transport sensor histidine kinase DctB